MLFCAIVGLIKTLLYCIVLYCVVIVVVVVVVVVTISIIISSSIVCYYNSEHSTIFTSFLWPVGLCCLARLQRSVACLSDERFIHQSSLDCRRRLMAILGNRYRRRLTSEHVHAKCTRTDELEIRENTT